MIQRWNEFDPGAGRRQQMIDETGAWLTWALESGVQLPRIPRVRVEDGGFTRLMRLPGARAAVASWWGKALDLVGSVSDRF